MIHYKRFRPSYQPHKLIKEQLAAQVAKLLFTEVCEQRDSRCSGNHSGAKLTKSQKKNHKN